MNIGKISGISFNGAYYITGRADDVAMADKYLQSKRGNKLNIDTAGAEYVLYEAPAYIFVTSGRDKKAYDEFIPRKKEYCDEIRKENPVEAKRSNFVNVNDFILNKINYEANIHMAAVNRYCDLTCIPKVLGAQKVLEAIRDDKFDFENGEIQE